MVARWGSHESGEFGVICAYEATEARESLLLGGEREQEFAEIIRFCGTDRGEASLAFEKAGASLRTPR
jgi:hypothetical protein